jgi:hypothetical protein
VNSNSSSDEESVGKYFEELHAAIAPWSSCTGHINTVRTVD